MSSLFCLNVCDPNLHFHNSALVCLPRDLMEKISLKHFIGANRKKVIAKSE